MILRWFKLSLLLLVIIIIIIIIQGLSVYIDVRNRKRKFRSPRNEAEWSVVTLLPDSLNESSKL
jgi:hypothetical protein